MTDLDLLILTFVVVALHRWLVTYRVPRRAREAVRR